MYVRYLHIHIYAYIREIYLLLYIVFIVSTDVAWKRKKSFATREAFVKSFYKNNINICAYITKSV